MKFEIVAPDLTGYQEAFLYSEARYTIVEASTKVGKTFSHIWWIFERAHAEWNEPGFNHWWVAPSHNQAEIAFQRIKQILRGVPGYKINNSSPKTITTPIGSIIHFKTAKDPDSLFGEDVYSVVFDEAPRASYAAFVALRSTVTFTNAPIKMIGNFGGKSNWMHVLKEKSKEDSKYAYFKVTAWDAVEAGILDREEVEQAQRDLSTAEFKSLYLAEEMESEDMLCSYEAIDNLFTNDFVKSGSKYITADIALHGSDRFVLFVWDGFRIIHVHTQDKCEADEVEKLIKQKANEYQVPRSNIVYDADGLGSFLRGYLRGAIPFNNGAAPVQTGKRKVNYKNLKTQCGYLLATMINKAEIFIQCEVDTETKSAIIQELECLQSYDTDNDGKIQLLPKKKIKEVIGRSPDFLDALALRIYPTIRPRRTGPKRSTFISS